jgi:small subunit ribosomal protein S20
MPAGTATKVKKRKPSVLKRAKQALVHAERNRSRKTRVRSLIKKLRGALDAKDAAAAETLFRPTLSAIDKAIGNGTLHENTANRTKSRLSVAYNAVRTAKAS